MMRFVGLFIAVLVVSVVQMYAAGPIGLAGGLDRGSIIVAMFIGGMIGVVAIVFFGPALFHKVGNLVRRVLGRPPKSEAEAEEPSTGRIARTTERLGPWGPAFLGITGPLTIGGWGAAVLGVSMGMSKGRLIFWLAVGQAIVTVGFIWALKAATG